MSFPLLALSACTFALGFAEFVAVSLVPAISVGTGLNPGSVGAMIGIYALGVSIGAPTLSALLAKAPRQRVLAICMLVFAAGNAVTAMTLWLPALLGSRFIAGLMHGVVLALASSTAAAAVEPERSGNAIATVFGGLTVALVVGVPLGTLAGAYFRWEDVFIAIAIIGAFGAIAVTQSATSAKVIVPSSKTSRLSLWATLLDTKTLHTVLITALAYAGSFTGFTYIAVLFEKVTLLDASGVTGMFFLYGISAAIGNALGGRLVDRIGSRAATLCVVGGISVALGMAYVGGSSIMAMSAAMILWGLASFGAVPVLQKTVLIAAQLNPRGSTELASGMNIAAFNIGIAVGSMAGGIASAHSPVAPMLAGIIPLMAAGILASRLSLRAGSSGSSTGSFTNQGV